MLAEIADKMPTLEAVWGLWILFGLLAATATLGLSLVRLWIGGAIVVLAGCLALLAARPDEIMDPSIIRELGSGYLIQQRASAFVPFGFALVAWILVARLRFRRQPGPGDFRTPSLRSPSSRGAGVPEP